MKQCRDCARFLPKVEFVKNKVFKDGHDTLCLGCNRKRVLAWRKANPEKRALQAQREGKKDYNKNKYLKATYGISLVEYNTMFENQQGCCAICGTHQIEFSRSLSVDHCHATGKIRKLLCGHCNTLLGMAKDDPKILQKAIDYLKH